VTNYLVMLVMDGAGDWDGSTEFVESSSPEDAIKALNDAWGSMLVQGEVYAVAAQKSLTTFGAAKGFVVQQDLSVIEWEEAD